MSKRTDYIVKNDYYMALAFLAAKRSKDPKTQVGASIINKKGIVVALGYNGFPRGCNDDKFPWAEKARKSLDEKYLYVVHAEPNAIHNRNSFSLEDCVMYVTLAPCNRCAQDIIQAGIKEVVYYENKHRDRDTYKAARKMFKASGVKQRKYRGNLKGLELIFKK